MKKLFVFLLGMFLAGCVYYVDTEQWGGYGEPVVVNVVDMVEDFQALYADAVEDKAEYSLCLSAKKVMLSSGIYSEQPVPSYHVDKATWPINYVNVDSVRHQFACPIGTVGWAHTHPLLNSQLRCNRSADDLKTFWELNLDFMVIVCSPSRYRWYTRNGSVGDSEFVVVDDSIAAVLWKTY